MQPIHCFGLIDLVVVLDRSGSMRNVISGVADFARALVGQFAFGPTALQVSIVSFSTIATLRTGLSGSRSEVDAAIGAATGQAQLDALTGASEGQHHPRGRE